MLRFTRALVALAVMSAVLVAAPAAPAAAENTDLCHHPTWGGTYYCKYNHEVRTLADGTIYFFVVNINYQVWARWRNTRMQFSDWTSLGGTVWHDPIIDGTPDDLRSAVCGPYVVVLVRGTNGTWYHRKRFADGSWSGWINSYWYSCD